MEKIKERLSDEGRKRLMTVAELLRKEGREEGIKEGIKEGRKEERVAIAKKMLELHISEGQIIEVTGLSKEEVNELKANLDK